jgi:hypothetical protein
MINDNFYKEYGLYIKNIVDNHDFNIFWKIYNITKHSEKNYYLKAINPNILIVDDEIILLSKIWILLTKIILLEFKPKQKLFYKNLYVFENDMLIPRKILFKKAIIMIPSNNDLVDKLHGIKYINNFYEVDETCYDYNYNEYKCNKKLISNNIYNIRDINCEDIEYKILLTIFVKDGSNHWSRLDLKEKLNELLSEDIYKNICISSGGATSDNSKRKLTENDLNIITQKLNNDNLNLSILFD